MWKNRNIWIILTGEMIAGLGLWTGIIGNLEFMQEKIPSDFVKALIMSAGLLAGIIAGPLAGKIIDQSKKKTVLLISGAGRMLSVIFMLIAISTGSVWWMVAFMVSIQLSATFYFPALQATIPLVVKDDDLLAMNGWHMNVATISRVLGTALAGIMLVYWSLMSLYWISMIAYGALLLFTMMLRIDEGEAREAKVKSVGNKGGFMEVFPVLKAYPAVGMTLIMTLIPLLFIGSFNLIVINISEIQDSASIKGLIYTFEGLAFMVGTFAVKYISKKWRTTTILFSFATMVAVAEFMLFFAESTVITLSAFAVLGFALRLFFPNSNGHFSETDAERVPWPIFLVPQYVRTGHVPGRFTDSRCISRYYRIAIDGYHFRIDQFKHDSNFLCSDEKKKYHIRTTQTSRRKKYLTFCGFFYT